MKLYGLRLGFSVLCATIAGLLSFSAPLAGAGRSDDPRTDRRAAARNGAARPVTGTPRGTTTVAARTASIVGSAWNVDDSPIRFANLRLRNVIDGRIEGLAKANDAGRFAFDEVAAGSYVVELLSDAGKVETVGHVFTIAPGESVATFVRLGRKVPWFASFFNNTAGAVASTAASGGITAIAPPALCSSPPCHD